MTHRAWKRAAPALLVAGSVTLALLLGESLVATLLRFPAAVARLPRTARGHVTNLYFNRLRDIIQFDERMAQWDPELFYTLRRGRFTFVAPEFSTDFSVNSLGVRDDEGALRDPQIIVIGDSFAMGWGVGQSLAFPKQIERLTGMKTLNLGISSYGTVRERILLDRVRTAPKYLIIQYCDNDVSENAAFAAAGNHYHARTRDEYRQLAAYNSSNIRYYPGKYLDSFLGVSVFGNVWRYHFVLPPWEELPSKPVENTPAPLFLNALLHAGKMDLSGTRIILFEVKQLRRRLNREFIESVARELHSGRYPDYLNRMVLADVSATVRPEHYFVLDDHLTAEGHAQLAFMLAQLVRGG